MIYIDSSIYDMIYLFILCLNGDLSMVFAVSLPEARPRSIWTNQGSFELDDPLRSIGDSGQLTHRISWPHGISMIGNLWMEFLMEFIWNWNFYDWTFMNGVSMEFRWNFYGNLWMFYRNLWMFLLADMEFHRIEPASPEKILYQHSEKSTHDPQPKVVRAGYGSNSNQVRQWGRYDPMIQFFVVRWRKKTALSAYSSYTSDSPMLIMLVIWWCPAAIFSSAEYEVYKII